jgi:PEP-CTERM motif
VITDGECVKEVHLRFFNASKLLLIGLGFLVCTLFAQGAKADTLDFACGGGTACTGTVTSNGGSFSTTGIGLTANFESDPFSLVFDTATGSIQLVEDSTDKLIGTIDSFSSSTGGGFTNVSLAANWTSLPGDVNGTSGVTPFTFVMSLSGTGQAVSVDVPVATSTPEPSSLLLLGMGLVGLVLYPKRKAATLA